MAIDPNIALGYKGLEAPNPLAQYAQVAQIQNAQNQNAMAQYQLSAAKRADELTNVQNELYAKHFNPATGQVNMNALSSDLAQRGFGGQIPAMQAKQQELEGKIATTSKTKADAAEARRKLISQAERDISTRPSDANITAYLEDIQGSDLFNTQEKTAVTAKMKQLLTVPMAQRADILAQSGASSSDYTTRRGQNMVDARARERLAQEAQAVTYQTDSDGNIVAMPTKLAPGAVPTAQSVIAPGGGMTPLKAKDSSKTAVSEQQASYNIGRVLTAAKEIGKIVEKNPSVVKPGAGEALASSVGLSGTANATRSADRQIVYGAQRDALDALLYLATGAAYNKEQLQGQMAAYIPAYTDEPEAVAAKQVRMAELIKSAKARAGKSWTPEMESAMQSLTNPAGAATGSVDTSNPLLK